MDLNKIREIAKSLGADNSKLNQVIDKATDYGIIKDGKINASVDVAKKVISENGGNSMLDKAVSKANNPLIRIGLKKIGIGKETIEAAVKEIRGVTGTTTAYEEPTRATSQRSSIKDRLNKLV